MQGLEKFLDKVLGPVAAFMNKSRFFQALSEAFMRITPVTLGAAVLMIIGNFPVPAWITFIETSGLKPHFNAIIGATTNALTLYVTFNFGYIYARNSKVNALTGGLLALAAFFIITPQTLEVAQFAEGVITNGMEFPASVMVSEMKVVEAWSTTYTSGTGLLTGIFAAWLSGVLYVKLVAANLTVKLPPSVPANVAESLSPSLLSGVIFIVFFLIRIAFAYLPFLNMFGSVFNFIFGMIQLPLQKIGGHPISMIAIFTLANMCWFFGIHPNMIYGAVMPILVSNGTENIVAFMKGEPMPYLVATVIGMAAGNAFGGQGSTIGLVVAMFSAKSERYKEMRKLAVGPSIFNINEPLIFGMPIMLNTVFFLPLVLSPIFMGLAAWGLTYVTGLVDVGFNPTIGLPWTTPALVTSFVQGGWRYGLIAVACFIISIVTWFPFFKIADKEAVQAELAMTDTAE